MSTSSMLLHFAVLELYFENNLWHNWYSTNVSRNPLIPFDSVDSSLSTEHTLAITHRERWLGTSHQFQYPRRNVRYDGCLRYPHIRGFPLRFHIERKLAVLFWEATADGWCAIVHCTTSDRSSEIQKKIKCYSVVPSCSSSPTEAMASVTLDLS